MTSQSPPQMQFTDHTIILLHFIRQVESQHIWTSTQEPIMLHFDSKTKGLVEYGWPVDPVTEERVPPNQLQAHRRSHDFCGPSCFCAFLEGKSYTEAEIAIVEVGGMDEERTKVVLNGEYIAICAERRCGFFLCLKRFYHLEGLREEVHYLRAKPLALNRLVYVSDIGKSYCRGDGLCQIMPDVVACGRIGGLQTIDPKEIKAVEAKAVADLMLRVSEEAFWNTFVQCLGCKQVQFCRHYTLNHRCPSPDVHTLKTPYTPRPHPYRHSGPSQQPRHRRARFYAHMSTIIGDSPSTKPMRGMTHLKHMEGAPSPTSGTPEDKYSSEYPLTEISDGDYNSSATDEVIEEGFASDDDLPNIPQLLFAFETDRPVPPAEVGGTSPLTCGDLEPTNSQDPRATEEQLKTFWTGELAAAVRVFDAPDEAGDDNDGSDPKVQASSDRDPVGGGVDHYHGSDYSSEESPANVSSDDIGPPTARTSDMEKWSLPYDEIFDVISRINGPLA